MPLPKPPTKRASRLDSDSFATNLSPSKRPPALEAPSAPPVASLAETALPAASAPAPASPSVGPASSAPTRQRTEPVEARGGNSPSLALVPPAAAKAPAKKAAPSRAKTRKTVGDPKLFVLDTNVLMHDPMSLFRFEEHDIYLPMITLEELDGHKKGMTEVARNVRQVSRDAGRAGGVAQVELHRGDVQGPAAGPDRPPRGGRQAVLPDHAVRDAAAAGPAPGQGRQPDPGRRAGAARRSNPAARWCWCPRTSTCASRPARWACRRRTTATTRRSRTPTCSTPACRRCRRTSGNVTARRWRAGSKAAPRSTGSAGRWCPRCWSTSSSTWKRPAPRLCTRRCRRSPARPPCCAR